MKRKVYLFLLTVAILSLLVVAFAFTASAEEIKVTYNWIGGYQYDVAKPNEDGSYTLRTNKQSSNATSALADGTVVDREFYGWFDEKGNLYAPGETVYFTESTMLYEAYGITVYNAEDFVKNSGHCYIKLGADITLTAALGKEWCAHTTNLNGHTLTSTASSIATVKRGSFIVHGPGKIVHAPATVKTGIDESAVYIWGHGYGDDDAPQQFWIGKGVELTTPYSAFRCGSVAREKHPKIAIAGTVNARALARINAATTEATCKIYDTANITTSVSFIEFANQTGTNRYMYITIDGVINVANGTSNIFTDFALEKIDFIINGGKFCISEQDVVNIGYYLNDSLMLKQTTEGDLVWYEVIASDCEHNWIKDDEQSVSASLGVFGKDVFDCSLCGREKTVITVYDPSNTEIIVTVVDENGELVNVTAEAKDFLEFSITGVGENTSFAVIGVKGTEEFPVESVIAVSIPAGVSTIAFSMTNETLQTINIGDGLDVVINNLEGLKAVKTINIGASNVKFVGIKGNTSLESIVSSVAGANIIFADRCFDGKSNIKYLTMANGSSYSFGTNSFQKTGVESVVFPDEATVTFTGDAAFYNAAVKYVYFGDSITRIDRKPFDCAEYLEVVVIKAATYIDQYCFCVAGANNSKAVISVYCHSADVSINSNAFVNRQNNGVVFYTIDPDIKSLSGCKYTVYNGIPHAYAEGIIKAPTCIETGIAGSTTDCVCGVNEIATYTIYTAEGSTEGSTAQRELPLSDIHVLGTTLAGIDYKDGYIALGTKLYFCALCNEATVEEAEPTADKILTSYGYSVSTYGAFSVVQSYGIDHKAYNEYISFNPDFRIGTVASGNLAGELIQPLKVENGAVVGASNKVIVGDFNVMTHEYFEIRVRGISESTMDVSIVFCAYIYDGEKIVYIENGETVDSVKGCTYNSLVTQA